MYPIILYIYSMKGYIYALKCPLINKIRYIGQTIQKPTYRFSNHLSDARNSSKNTKKTYWLRKLMKSNLLPELIIIESIENVTKEQLDSREIYWINIYKHEKFVNSTDGGNNVCKAIQIYQRRTIDKKVYSYNEITKELKEYKNTKEAALSVNVTRSIITRTIFSKGRCKNLFWSYNSNFDFITISKQFTKIAVYNESFYKEYNSIWEAMDSLNIPRTCKSRIGYRLNDGLPYYGMYFKRLVDKSKAGPKSKQAPLVSNDYRITQNMLETPYEDNQQG